MYPFAFENATYAGIWDTPEFCPLQMYPVTTITENVTFR